LASAKQEGLPRTSISIEGTLFLYLVGRQVVNRNLRQHFDAYGIRVDAGRSILVGAAKYGRSHGDVQIRVVCDGFASREVEAIGDGVGRVERAAQLKRTGCLPLDDNGSCFVAKPLAVDRNDGVGRSV
jgi:hypothetical protein